MCEEFPASQGHTVDEVISWEFQRNSDGPTSLVVSDGSRVVVGNRRLVISNLRLEDNGTYFCVASHPLVAPIKTVAMLQVEGKIS